MDGKENQLVLLVVLIKKLLNRQNKMRTNGELETGLYYYGARYYDPVVGRFISADSMVPDPSNPQDFNRYTYVRNNPIIYSDPTGHFILSAILLGAAISGAFYTTTAVANNSFQFNDFMESVTIGAFAGLTGAAVGAGTYALLGETALAGLGLGGDIMTGALVGAASGGAAYSAGVAAAGGQWTWERLWHIGRNWLCYWWYSRWS